MVVLNKDAKLNTLNLYIDCEVPFEEWAFFSETLAIEEPVPELWPWIPEQSTTFQGNGLTNYLNDTTHDTISHFYET